MSLFITFEGGEGCGKSVQAKILYDRLSQTAFPAVLTHEPGGTPLGDKISRWLKWTGGENLSPLTELMLFNASRAQLVAEVIRPGLKKRKVVICDRYSDSTTAYQGYGRGLDLEVIKAVNHAATQEAKPDLTVLLDIPAQEGLARKAGEKQDRFEKEALAFHERVRRGYLELTKEEPERWLVIDAKQAKETIAETIWRRVNWLLHQGD